LMIAVAAPWGLSRANGLHHFAPRLNLSDKFGFGLKPRSFGCQLQAKNVGVGRYEQR
jgi:hypothetical protein